MDRKMTVLAFGLVLLAVGVYLYGTNLGSWLRNFGNQSTVLDTMKIEIIAENGTSVATLEPKTPLSIVAIFGSKSMDITNYFLYTGTYYYFKFSPVVKPTFTATGTVKIKYDITWEYLTYAEQAYPQVYRLSRIAQAENTITLPYTSTVEVSNPASGQPLTISDQTAVIIAKITNAMQKPDVGSSYDLKGRLTVVATLYVNGMAQGAPLKQSADFIVMIKNQPDGVLSAVDVSVDVGTAQAMW
jgi:hypothetical protein